MMKPGAGARGGREEEEDDDDVQVLVERPYSHDHPPPPPPRQPGHQQQQQQLIRARPYYRRWSPWLVSGATVACVALFLATMYVNDCPRQQSPRCAAGFLGRFAFQPLKENPLLGPSSATLVKMGALDVTKVVHGGQGWRLLTCMWLHAGVVHLLINMLCLVLVGVRLEQEFGFLRIGLVYLVSGFGGSLMSGLFIRSTGVVSVGASGALFGLVGSMLSELITNWSLYANKVAALVSLLLVIAVNLALGVLPHVDNFAHIGGLVSGFLLGFVVFVRPHFDWLNHQRRVVVAAAASAGGAGAPPPAATPTPAPAPAPPPVNKRRKHKTYQYVLWVAAAVLLVAGFAAAVVLLFRGYNANDHCSWCHYLSCVPTKHWKCDSSSPTTWCSFNTTVEGGGNTTAASVVCQWGGGRNRTVPLPGAPPDRPEARNDLCKQLCT